MTTNTNIFEQATRQKVRFTLPDKSNIVSRVGLSTEDLWDLSLEQLDLIAQNLDNLLRNAPTKSFVKDLISQDPEHNQLKLDLVIAVIEYKKAAKAKAAERLQSEQRKLLAREALANKESALFSTMSKEELQKIIDGEY